MAKKQYQDVLMAHQSEMDGEHQKKEKELNEVILAECHKRDSEVAEKVEAERQKSKAEIDQLKSEIQRLNTEIETERYNIKVQQAELLEEHRNVKAQAQKLAEESANLFSLLNMLKKVSTTSCQLLPVVGTAIVTVVGMIMKHTMVHTRLRAVVDAIFKSKIFGEPYTSMVLHDMSKKYARKYVFKPWKILEAMDLSPSGAFNFQGLETLRGIECLQKYERGFLPASSPVQ